jgi:hypothetical protein
MARKSAVLLKSAPVKVDKAGKALMAQLAKIEPVAGLEEHWNRYLTAVLHNEEVMAREEVVAAQLEKRSTPELVKAHKSVQHEGDKATKATFGALDAYRYAVAHKDDKINVPEEDVRFGVIESLNDKLDGELVFSMNLGLVGSKVAQAIRKETASVPSFEDAPFCPDCS